MHICSITELTGFKIGHAQDREGATGVTVITSDSGQGLTAGVDVRGSAPGTRETDLLRPTNLVEQVHAVFLAGGSAFGLDAGSGIMSYLDEQNIGFPTGYAKVPIVTGAILFDLGIGDPKTRPDAAMGYQAAESAKSLQEKSPTQGCVGAGTGAIAGKFLGEQYAMKTGLGIAAVKTGKLIVGAIIAVNCFGEVLNPNDEKSSLLAGAFDSEKEQFVTARTAMSKSHRDDFVGDDTDNNANTTNESGLNQNTTIGAVMTNAKLSKAGATKVSQMAHSGLSRTMRPAHSMLDGDAIFTLASGEVDSEITLVGDMASLAVEKAVINGTLHAKSSHGFPSYQDIANK